MIWQNAEIGTGYLAPMWTEKDQRAVLSEPSLLHTKCSVQVQTNRLETQIGQNKMYLILEHTLRIFQANRSSVDYRKRLRDTKMLIKQQLSSYEH